MYFASGEIIRVGSVLIFFQQNESEVLADIEFAGEATDENALIP